MKSQIGYHSDFEEDPEFTENALKLIGDEGIFEI